MSKDMRFERREWSPCRGQFADYDDITAVLKEYLGADASEEMTDAVRVQWGDGAAGLQALLNMDVALIMRQASDDLVLDNAAGVAETLLQLRELAQESGAQYIHSTGELELLLDY